VSEINAVQRAQEVLDSTSVGRAARLHAAGSVAPPRDSLIPLSHSGGADADQANISPSGTLLGRLGELSRTSPEFFGQFMAEGAREIRTGVDAGAFRDPSRLQRVADGLDRAASAKDLSKLERTAFGSSKPGQTPDEIKLTDALQARVDAALGLRAAPPFGPWFPRDKR
jgi:hypothetical protein